MKTKTKLNFGQYFAIEKNLRNFGDHTPRNLLISEFSNGLHDSLTDLSVYDYQRFIKWLVSREYQLKIGNPQEEKKNRIRRKIIALFCKMDWKTPDGRSDMERIECWAIKYGKYHKRLNEHNLSEITELCSQVEKVYGTYIQSL